MILTLGETSGSSSELGRRSWKANQSHRLPIQRTSVVIVENGSEVLSWFSEHPGKPSNLRSRRVKELPCKSSFEKPRPLGPVSDVPSISNVDSVPKLEVDSEFDVRDIEKVIDLGEAIEVDGTMDRETVKHLPAIGPPPLVPDPEVDTSYMLSRLVEVGLSIQSDPESC